MKINYSKKILIISLSIFVVVLVADIVFGNLLYNKIISINDKIKQLEISSQERLNELTLRESITGSEANREKLGEYFVGAGNAEVVNFTQYLEDLAQEIGVSQKKTLDYEVISELPASASISAIRYRFNITGKWSNVFNFIQAIESLPRVVLLKSVSISLNSGVVSAKEVNSASKNWTADLDFMVVKLKD